MNEASAARHLENMEEKHRVLEKSIHVEESRPAPDASLIHKMKVQKLRIRDAMASFVSKFKKQ